MVQLVGIRKDLLITSLLKTGSILPTTLTDLIIIIDHMCEYLDVVLNDWNGDISSGHVSYATFFTDEIVDEDLLEELVSHQKTSSPILSLSSSLFICNANITNIIIDNVVNTRCRHEAKSTRAVECSKATTPCLQDQGER